MDDHDQNVLRSDEEEDEFDFSFAVNSPALTPDASEIFPIFNRKLFISDPDPTDARSESASSTSSNCIAGDFCTWSPDRACKKSSSTGSGPGSTSKRWKMKDVVKKRSHSDGKEKLHYLNSDPGKGKASSTGTGADAGAGSGSVTGENKKKGIKEMDLVTAHKLFYGKEKGGEKGDHGKRSFLPYKPELVGLFAYSRAHHHHPFNS